MTSYLSEIQNDQGHSIFLRALKESHGYRAVVDGFTSLLKKQINIYPTNLSVIQNSVGVIIHREGHYVKSQNNGMVPGPAKNGQRFLIFTLLSK